MSIRVIRIYIQGIDALLAGIATHYVPYGKLETVAQELLLESSDIDTVLKPYLPNNVKQEFSLSPYTDLINECFSAPTVEDIISRLYQNKYLYSSMQSLVSFK